MLVTQPIDHHKETIFTKWVQLPGELMENPGGVCDVLPATCRARPLRSALMENMVDVCGVLPKT